MDQVSEQEIGEETWAADWEIHPSRKSWVKTLLRASKPKQCSNSGSIIRLTRTRKQKLQNHSTVTLRREEVGLLLSHKNLKEIPNLESPRNMSLREDSSPAKFRTKLVRICRKFCYSTQVFTADSAKKSNFSYRKGSSDKKHYPTSKSSCQTQSSP